LVPVIVGRLDELSRVHELISGASSGLGGALVVAGEAGMGKTSILTSAVEAAASALQAVTVQGVESERDLPFAALSTLLRDVTPALDGLPDRHRAVLGVALGNDDGPTPSRLALGSALLAALASVGAKRPLLLVVDDIQWLDRPSADAIAFCARRVRGMAIAVLIGRRTGTSEVDAVDGLDTVTLPGLGQDDLRRLLPDAHPRVVSALVDAAAGNPLAVIEAAAALEPEVREGRRPMHTLPVTDPERAYAVRLARFPRETSDAARVLALAGAAPRQVVLSALTAARLDLEALAPLEREDLATLRDRVVWRHPLVRAAAGRGTSEQLRSAHLLLAAAWTSSPDHPARTWHLAESATAPDADIAASLEALAESAGARQAAADAADAWERSARLTAEAEDRRRRLEAAARAALRAGLTRRAADLLDEALQQQPSAAGAALLLALRARIEHTLGHPALAWDLFMQAVDLTDDPDLRVLASAESLYSAMYLRDPQLALRASRLVDAHHDPDRDHHVFLREHARGAAASLLGDLPTARHHLDQALELLEDSPLLETHPDLLLWVVNADFFADRVRPLHRSARASIDRLRERGDLTWLPRVVRLAALSDELLGEWATAYAALEEAELLSRMSGQVTQVAEALLALADIEAARGLGGPGLRHATEARQLVTAHGIRWLETEAAAVEGRIRLGLGEVTQAVELLTRAVTLGATYALHDLVDSLRSLGNEEAARRLADLDLGAEDRRLVDELLADDVASARALIARADSELLPFEAARLRLAAGERLRRSGERRESRAQLRRAGEAFASFGAAPWVARVDEELRASGATLRKDPSGRELTPSELRIASLVAEGHSNKDVGALLHLSPKTVEFHLGRVYRKVGVGNRTALARALRHASSGDDGE
jgi:DNA-binding CsgD family transcriptional regulator